MFFIHINVAQNCHVRQSKRNSTHVFLTYAAHMYPH